MHGLKGYLEVIESVTWALNSLNHDVSYSINSYTEDAINIIFGAQVLPIQTLESLPSNSLIFNLEVFDKNLCSQVGDSVKHYARNFQIIDYSLYNSTFWNFLGARPVYYLPIGYTKNLTRIAKLEVEDIDVLIYGSSSNDRLYAFHELSHAGLKVIFVSGLYGSERDHLIGRSKIILNVNNNEIFEIVRASYLFANKKAVVSSFSKPCFIEDDIHKAFLATNLENIAVDCQRLINDPERRTNLESAGYETFIKRDFVKSLSLVISSMK
jgi:hypothetical protein